MADKIVHPTDEEIKMYMTSNLKLVGEALMRVWTHIKQCDDCASRLSDFSEI